MLASIEAGGMEAVAFSSGCAAIATVLQSLGPNAHIISSNVVYGGTFRFMTQVAAENQGLESTFIDLEKASEEEIYNEIKENTKLIWLESPTNPTLDLVNIPKVVNIARSHPSRPFVLCDGTFLSPYWASPIMQGADLVLHSLTKYINGHSDVVLGAVVVPPRHHNDFGLKLRFLQNAIGAVPSPHDCWLAQRGAKTLQLRMKAHGENAFALAKYLESSPYVKECIYPGLPSHPLNDVAWEALSPHARKFVESLGDREERGGFPFGGMIAFRIRGDDGAGERFLMHTKLFTLAESLGGVESLAELPARMTHHSVPPEDRARMNIGLDLVRLSVGIEDVEDLIADVKQSLEFAVDQVDAVVPSAKLALMRKKLAGTSVANTAVHKVTQTVAG
ncbi:hypothetical protein FRB98_002080 [Tulasnella sp. 332]|nr:hypothetical protein FRB98_002080 [Tulasnella sp. 332]